MFQLGRARIKGLKLWILTIFRDKCNVPRIVRQLYRLILFAMDKLCLNDSVYLRGRALRQGFHT